MSAARLAWGLFGAFAAVWLALLGLTVFGPASTENLLALVIVSYPLVGALVASRLPGNAVGWLLLGTGVALVLGALADACLSASPPIAPTLSAWVSNWTWGLAVVVPSTLLPLLFPDGRLVSRRWRPALWLAVAATATGLVGQAFRPGAFDPETISAPPENPLGLGGALGDLATAMADAGGVMSVAAVLAAGASLVARFRRSRGAERQQLKWFAYAALLAVMGLVVAIASSELSAGGALDAAAVAGWFTALLAIGIGIPVATGIAVLRHRLYDIDVVINRTLVYAALTATLAGTYVGSVLVLQLVLSPGSGLAVAVSTLAAAAVFRPARARIQATVDRRFYRRRYDAQRTLAAFATRLRDEIELDALSAELRDVVAHTVQPAHVSLWLRSRNASRTAGP
jgi:hypothetical protein